MSSRPRMEIRGALILWNAFLAVFSIMGALRTWTEFLQVLLKRTVSLVFGRSCLFCQKFRSLVTQSLLF